MEHSIIYPFYVLCAKFMLIETGILYVFSLLLKLVISTGSTSQSGKRWLAEYDKRNQRHCMEMVSKY
jgi:hypothetical protein